ncbi:MAG: hypothetical protein KC996_03570 [Phycisphaerales bacterium]|nr:hypothetical protein [Phycisphaerales bacterium]
MKAILDDSAPTTADRYFLVDSLNPTGYAQVLVERSGGEQSATLAKRYAVGDDMLGQQVGSAMQSLLMDGHGSTRQLYDDGVVERYDYDAFGEAFHYELDEPDSSVMRPSTDLLYVGEQWGAALFHCSPDCPSCLSGSPLCLPAGLCTILIQWRTHAAAIVQDQTYLRPAVARPRCLRVVPVFRSCPADA